MNRKYGIGFFVGTIALIVLFILIYRTSYHHALDQTEAEKHSQNELEICYYIRSTDGYVTVYESDQKTVYEYTSILVEDLPEELQDDLKKGIKVTSPGQAYGFLENYSS